MAWNEFLHSQVWVRFLLYGFLGYFFEIFFTATMDLLWPQFLCSWNVHANAEPSRAVPLWRQLRDRRLVGYTFIWMFPIYGLIVFMEPLSFYFQVWGIPYLLRCVIYAVIFMIAEYLSGLALKLLIGKCPWDYRYSKLSIGGYTRWDYFVVWFLVSLALEKLLPVWVELTPHIINAFQHL